MQNRMIFSQFVILFLCGVGYCQDSMLQKTLDIRDISSSINQTVVEEPSNEKNIDFADYDNDGDLDVVMSSCLGDFGQRCNKLYRNDDGVFNEVSGVPVIPEFENDDVSRTCLFRDFDKDGFADIVVVCDSNSGTATVSAPGRTKFLRNIGGQFFVNETERLDNLSGAAGDGVAGDFDQNGLLDVVLANHPNLSRDSMVLNGVDGLSAGEFCEKTSLYMPNENEYGAQIHSADMNGDGLLDLIVSNMFSEEAIYFNNNSGAGMGTGDFSYGGQGNILTFPELNNSVTTEQALFPVDLNNDGLIDLVHTNFGPGSTSGPRFDGFWMNMGNNTLNVPEFAAIEEINDDFNSLSTRVEATDLDDDGRQDLVVLSRFRRPYIFRNTSENGDISFVAWTPATLNDQHFGWGIGARQLVGDGRPDLFLGATDNDFLFETTSSASFSADDLTGGELPDLLDQPPIQITGLVGGNGVTFNAGTIPASARVSVLLRSSGDVKLQALVNNNIITESDRPGHSTDEFLQFVHTSGELEIEVILDSPSYDGNGDGAVNLLDVAPFIDCLTGVSTDCDPFDTDDDGQVNLLDVGRFLERLTGPADEAYSLEILIRSD